jgi:hypothetical protein
MEMVMPFILPFEKSWTYFQLPLDILVNVRKEGTRSVVHPALRVQKIISI